MHLPYKYNASPYRWRLMHIYIKTLTVAHYDILSSLRNFIQVSTLNQRLIYFLAVLVKIIYSLLHSKFSIGWGFPGSIGALINIWSCVGRPKQDNHLQDSLLGSQHSRIYPYLKVVNLDPPQCYLDLFSIETSWKTKLSKKFKILLLCFWKIAILNFAQ